MDEKSINNISPLDQCEFFSSKEKEMVSPANLQVLTNQISVAISELQIAMDHAKRDDDPNNKPIWLDMLGYLVRIQDNLNPLIAKIRQNQLNQSNDNDRKHVVRYFSIKVEVKMPASSDIEEVMDQIEQECDYYVDFRSTELPNVNIVNTELVGSQNHPPIGL